MATTHVPITQGIQWSRNRTSRWNHKIGQIAGKVLGNIQLLLLLLLMGSRSWECRRAVVSCPLRYTYIVMGKVLATFHFSSCQNQ